MPLLLTREAKKKGTHTGFSRLFFVSTRMVLLLLIEIHIYDDDDDSKRRVFVWFFSDSSNAMDSLSILLSSFAVISHSSNTACYIFSHSLAQTRQASQPVVEALKTIQQGFFFISLAVFLLIFIILLDLFFALNEHDLKMNEAVTPSLFLYFPTTIT